MPVNDYHRAIDHESMFDTLTTAKLKCSIIQQGISLNKSIAAMLIDLEAVDFLKEIHYVTGEDNGMHDAIHLIKGGSRDTLPSLSV